MVAKNSKGISFCKISGSAILFQPIEQICTIAKISKTGHFFFATMETSGLASMFAEDSAFYYNYLRTEQDLNEEATVIDETLALLDDYSEPDELQKIWERPDRDDYIQEQLENPSETSIIAKIKSKELSFLAKNSLESVNHLRFYLFVLSFNGLKLAEFCKRRKIPYSGTKGTKSVLLVQYYFAPWEEAIGELENFAYNGYNKNKGGGKASEVLKNRLGDKYSIWDIFGAYIGEDIISKWVKYTNQKASIMLGMKVFMHTAGKTLQL